MSTLTQTFTSNGAFYAPSNVVDTYVTVRVQGSCGAGPTQGGAIVVAWIPLTLLPVNVFIGEAPTSDPVGGNGYSGGGAGGSYGGGGSSAIVSIAQNSVNLVLCEAGGSSGADTVSGSSTWGGGGGGGYSGLTGDEGLQGGDPGGGGGSQGGYGGGSTHYGGGSYAGGTGVGSPTLIVGSSAGPGAPSIDAPGGVGGGGGGMNVNFGIATSFLDSSCTFISIGEASPGNTGLVEFSWEQADAPGAPTLLSPLSGVTIDATQLGVTFSGVYLNGGSADCGNLEAVALLLSTDGGATYYYFNGSALQSLPIYLAPTTGGGVPTSGEFTVVVPSGILVDGNTYTWTFSTQESFASLNGPEASPASFLAETAPTATLTAPTGEPGTLTPTVSWTSVISYGSQTEYRFVIYSAPALTPGVGTAGSAQYPTFLYDSGTVSSGGTSFVLPGTWAAGYTPFSGTTYYGYLLITSSGGNVANYWASTVFTPTLIGAGTTPVLTVVLGTEPTTQMPASHMTLTYSDGSLSTSIFGEFQATYVDNGDYGDILGANFVLGSATVASAYDLTAPFNVPITYRGRTAYINSGQIYYSPWSNVVTFSGVPSQNWWIVPGNDIGQSMLLWRLPSSGSGTTDEIASPTTPAMPGSLSASIIIDEWEQLGVFRPFGKSTAILVHGDIWLDEFDLDLYFETTAAWNQFKGIRDLQMVVLLKSDMEGATYWVTLGPDLNPGIVSRADRQVNPTRGLTIHCTPTDPPS